MAGLSRASELYHKIVGDPANSAKLLEDMVTRRRPEDDYLEFKGVGKIGEQPTKEYWSKALSGFANTEGGVLIWGIRATRIPDPTDPSRKIDGATDFDLAPNPLALAQLLKDVRLEATVDPVAGVEVVPVDAGKGDGSGFVVCLVPQSSQKPHRAALDPAKQYYQRIGDSFVILPHPLLRHMFYPQLRSNLGATITVLPPDGNRMRFECRLFNRGSASAVNLCAKAMVMADSSSIEISNASYWNPLGQESADGVLTSKAATSLTLHPEDDCLCFVAHCEMSIEGIDFIISMYSLHQEEQQVWVRFEKGELRPGLSKPSKPLVADGATLG